MNKGLLIGAAFCASSVAADPIHETSAELQILCDKLLSGNLGFIQVDNNTSSSIQTSVLTLEQLTALIEHCQAQ